MLLLGIAAGLCFPALMTLAMSGATASGSGLASGLAALTDGDHLVFLTAFGFPVAAVAIAMTVLRSPARAEVEEYAGAEAAIYGEAEAA